MEGEIRRVEGLTVTATASLSKAETAYRWIRERVAELLERIQVSGNTPGREADAWARSKLVKPAA